MLRALGVAENPLPRVEGTIPLPDGRALGYAEFGDEHGVLVLWFHGSPGARRQVPPVARSAADRLGLRLVCVERPGVGASSDHLYRDVRDSASDVEVVADHLGHDRFLVVGLSGGGPYALACAHEMADRVMAVGILGGVVPTTGEEAAAATGIVALARTYNRLLTMFRGPLGLGLRGFVVAISPAGHVLYRAYGQLLPHGDNKVLDDPELEAMFIDDLTNGARGGFGAFVNDLVLAGRPVGVPRRRRARAGPLVARRRRPLRAARPGPADGCAPPRRPAVHPPPRESPQRLRGRRRGARDPVRALATTNRGLTATPRQAAGWGWVSS